tara:strand:+ start:386 stop:1450 length:1065 start_codon:yes stop_codon:yes gene_type:complete
MKKNILFEHSIFLHQKTGGISKYIYNLNEYLNKNNFKSLIYSPLTINDNLKQKNKNNVFFIRFKKIPIFFTKIFYAINNILTLLKIVIYKPDILHYSYYNNFFLSIVNKPSVLTVYDLIHEKIKSKNYKFYKSKLVKKVNKIICISNQTKNDLIKYYNVKANKISVIYLGINQKKILRKKKKFILFVGHREGYKNFNNLIKAYGKSQYLKKNYKLIVFGLSNFNEYEKNLIKKHDVVNNVFFKNGNDNYLNSLYSKATVFVFPSYYEGFGIPILEAMRCGCPIACSNIDVFREISNNSCIYFNPKNDQSIKKSIEKIAKSKKLQNKLVRKGFSNIKKYTWEKCAKETIKVYNNL